jgi:hypothetical protein
MSVNLKLPAIGSVAMTLITVAAVALNLPISLVDFVFSTSQWQTITAVNWDAVTAQTWD